MRSYNFSGKQLVSTFLKDWDSKNLKKFSRNYMKLRGCSRGGELARISGMARLGEMVFIPSSHRIFYLSSIKKFVMSLEKDYLIKYFLQQGDVKPLCRTNVLILFN